MKEIIMRILKENFRGRMLLEVERENNPKWVSFETVAEKIIEGLAPQLAGAADQVLRQLEKGSIPSAVTAARNVVRPDLDRGSRIETMTAEDLTSCRKLRRKLCQHNPLGYSQLGTFENLE